MQVAHSRRPNVEWALANTGFLSKSRELQVKTLRPISANQQISMDYAPEKLESQVPFPPCLLARTQSNARTIYQAPLLALIISYVMKFWI